MLGFRQFLEEGEPNFVNHTSSGFIQHVHRLSDTHVLSVDFTKRSSGIAGGHEEGNNHWNVDFSTHKDNEDTEGSYNRGRSNKFSNQQRLSATIKIRKSLDHFIKNKKPRTLEMNGNTEGKRKIYAKIANRLAVKYKGKRMLRPKKTKAQKYTSSSGEVEHYQITTARNTSDTSVIQFPNHRKKIK